MTVARCPLRLDPASAFQPMQRRIERSLLNLQCFLRDLLQPLGDCPAVHRL